MHLPVAFGVLAVTTSFILAPSRPVQSPHRNPEPGVHLLTQEISALRTLYRLRVTPEQLQALLRLAPETMCKDRDYKKSKASDDYRVLLNDLRKALVEAEEDERISDLEEKVNDLHDSESPEVDDSYTVTEAARQRVRAVYKQLKPSQFAAYITSLPAEEILDPVDELITALQSVRELKADEWKASRDELAEELAWLAAGLDSVKAEKVYQDIVDLLNKTRELTAEAFKKKRLVLEKRGRKIIGELDPNEVLRHQLERTLADLLANPRLETALKARLEPEK